MGRISFPCLFHLCLLLICFTCVPNILVIISRNEVSKFFWNIFSEIKLVKNRVRNEVHSFEIQEQLYLLNPEQSEDLAFYTEVYVSSLPHTQARCVLTTTPAIRFSLQCTDVPHSILLSWPHGGKLYVCFSTFSLAEFHPLSFALIPPGRGNNRT